MRKGSYKDPKREKQVKKVQKRRYYRKTSNARNGSKPWTKHEINLVMEHSITDMELSRKIGRSVAAIQHKRAIHKKVDVEQRVN